MFVLAKLELAEQKEGKNGDKEEQGKDNGKDKEREKKEGWAQAAAQMRSKMAYLLTGKVTQTGTEEVTEKTGISDPILPEHRLLLSQTVTGRTAAVRQLKSVLHIDYERDVCRTIEQHVRSVVRY